MDACSNGAPELRPTARKPKYTGCVRLRGRNWEKPRPKGSVARRTLCLQGIALAARTRPLLYGLWDTPVATAEALRVLLYDSLYSGRILNSVSSIVYSTRVIVYCKRNPSYSNRANIVGLRELSAVSFVDSSVLLIILKAMRHHCPVFVFLRLIYVTPAPHFMAAVTGSFHSFLHHVSVYHFQIVRPADLREKVNERCRYVESVVSQLGGLVVPRKHVVIIVPTLSVCHEGYTHVLRRIDVLVIRFVAVEMGCRID